MNKLKNFFWEVLTIALVLIGGAAALCAMYAGVMAGYHQISATFCDQAAYVHHAQNAKFYGFCTGGCFATVLICFGMVNFFGKRH